MNYFFNFDKKIFKRFNYFLILQLLPIFILSSILIKEINPYMFKKQMIYYALSAFVFILATLIAWRKLNWWATPLFYLSTIGLLIAVKYVGHAELGSQRWLRLPGIPFNIQPSEVAKITVIMLLAYLISKRPPQKEGYGVLMFIKLSIIIIIPSIFIILDPDLGTTLMLLLTSFSILFLIGINWKIWLTLAIIAGISAPIGYQYLLKPYQKKRIYDALLSDKPSYQVRQSLIAIGSGGLEGQDKENATQTQLKFLPVATTDFLFAYLGERFGFKGMLILIISYILLIFNLFWISHKYKDDYLIKTYALGIAFLIFFHMTVNIYMIIGLAPVVGLPLPMFSHGGTSFILYAFIFGVLQNLIISKDSKRYNSRSKTNMVF